MTHRKRPRPMTTAPHEKMGRILQALTMQPNIDPEVAEALTEIDNAIKEHGPLTLLHITPSITNGKLHLEIDLHEWHKTWNASSSHGRPLDPPDHGPRPSTPIQQPTPIETA